MNPFGVGRRPSAVIGPVTTKACILAILANARLFIGLAHAPLGPELSGRPTFDSSPTEDNRPRGGKSQISAVGPTGLLTESAFRKGRGHFAQLRGHWALFRRANCCV